MNYFGQPQMLWVALAVMPALVVFMIFAWRSKQKLITQFVHSRLLASLTVGVSQTRQKVRLVLLATVVFFALLTLARPQWGYDWEEAKQRGLDIIIAIDTSKSMLASDVTPNRLARAKMASFDLMKLAKSDRLGLIAFAGSAFMQCPLTLDEEAFRQSVDALDVNIIPQGGTAISEAIDTAVESLEKSGESQKVLIIFTDGEDHDSEAVAAAEKAAAAGLKIFTIGVGSQQGEMIRIQNEQGEMVFLKDSQGNVVKSHLNETLLQQIATATKGGFYLGLRGPNPMEVLYQTGLAQINKGESASQLFRNYHERYRWPLSIAIALLILEMFLPQRGRIRNGEGKVVAENGGLKKAVALLVLAALPFSMTASPATSAMKKYQEGKFGDALADYEKALEKDTNNFQLYYNAGTAAYKAGNFNSAVDHFDSALKSPDVELLQKTYYNLGNTMFQAGEMVRTNEGSAAGMQEILKQISGGQGNGGGSSQNPAQIFWEEALTNYSLCLKLNTNDLDAKNNFDFVTKKLQELQKDQQKQPGGDGDQKPSEDAKKAKEQADEAVRMRQYRRAFEIMEASLKNDPTTQYYGDYIQRLRDVNGIKTNSVAQP